MSKYNARRTTIDNITFDSKREAERYCELKILLWAGLISELELQPTFVLVPSFTKNGIHYRDIKYIADFRYIENGKTIIEDVKGLKTDVYKIKRKLFEREYPDYTIKEVF